MPDVVDLVAYRAKRLSREPEQDSHLEERLERTPHHRASVAVWQLQRALRATRNRFTIANLLRGPRALARMERVAEQLEEAAAEMRSAAFMLGVAKLTKPGA